MSSAKAVELICNGSQDSALAEQKDEAKQRLRDLILCKQAEILLFQRLNLESHQVHLEARRGQATISGHVYSQEEKRQVMETVCEIINQNDLDDQLKIKEFRNQPREN